MKTNADGAMNDRLLPEDAQALDALIDAGYQLERVPEQLKPRARRVLALLGLLDVDVSRRTERIARLLAVIDELDVAKSTPAQLSAADQEALDAWVLSSYQLNKVPGSLRQRAAAHQALADLVCDAPVSITDTQRDDLIARTLAAVENVDDEIIENDHFKPIPMRNRWADVLSVAAVLLIAASVLWPVLSAVRDQSRRATCNANMQQVASALSGYTLDQDQMLPMATAGFGGGTWWNVGRGPGRSNSANLYTLPREKYLDLASLACPGNPNAPTRATRPDATDWDNLQQVSYSYRVMARPEKALWGSPEKLVIVSDRSPVILRAVHHQKIYPFESSPNHGGRGQHVLRADGSTEWLESPVLPSGDNIWLPKPIEILIDLAAKRAGIEPLKGTEAPAGRQDSFVGP